MHKENRSLHALRLVGMTWRNTLSQYGTKRQAGRNDRESHIALEETDKKYQNFAATSFQSIDINKNGKYN